MGQDYHIYIHGQGNGFGGNKKPSRENVKPNAKKKENVSAISEVENEDGVNAWAVAKGVRTTTGVASGKTSILATASKYIPAVAIIYAVLKLTDKAITTATDFNVRETGDYSFKMSYNNFKATANTLINPIRSIINFNKSEQEKRIENDKRKQTMELLGDNALNSIHNNGV